MANKKNIPVNAKGTTKAGTIDLTPSWESIVNTYLALMQSQPKNKVIWDNARYELTRLAKAYDAVLSSKV